MQKFSQVNCEDLHSKLVLCWISQVGPDGSLSDSIPAALNLFIGKNIGFEPVLTDVTGTRVIGTLAGGIDSAEEGKGMAGRGGAKLILGMSETKAKNVAVAGCLSAFVASVYVYTMKAVGGTDELQAAVDAFESEKASTSSQSASTST